MLLSDVLCRDRFGGHREDKDVTAQAKITLRRWRDGDLDSLVRYANNRAVWLNLRDRFPHPYTRGDAEGWIALCKSEQEPALQFAIELDGEAIGGVGLENLDDVYRMTADIGYWVAEPFWGRGIATAAVIETTAYAFARFPFERIQAMVFGWNQRSARVLEKAGYALEGTFRNSIFKDGRLTDSLVYARLRT
jgi:ribosomal-protein-alanine N-acetyltransferase